MSDAKENDEAGQNVPLTVEETQELVEAQVQLEDLAAPVSKGDTSNHVENGKEEVVAPVEDKIVKPEADSECIPQKDVLNSENTLQPVPVMDNAQVLNKTEGEYASDVKSKAEETPQCDKRIENDANVWQINMDTAETTVAVNPKAKQQLLAAGFHMLNENKDWHLKPGGRYFFTRNMSCLIAFAIGDKSAHFTSSPSLFYFSLSPNVIVSLLVFC